MIGSVIRHGQAASLRDLFRTNTTSATSQTSSTERASPGKALFSKLDSDTSGGISQTEFQTFVDAMSPDTRGALLAAQETGGTSATASTTPEDLFARVDSDGDGSVSRSELEAFVKANAPAGGRPPPPDGASTADPSSQLFAALDADGDGSVSEGELEAALADRTSTTASDGTTSSSETAALFSTIDTDGDGKISQSELEAHIKANRPDGPPPPPPTADSGTASTTTTDGTASTTTAAANLGDMLAAALAQYAADAYGRIRSTAPTSSLSAASISAVA